MSKGAEIIGIQTLYFHVVINRNHLQTRRELLSANANIHNGDLIVHIIGSPLSVLYTEKVQIIYDLN